MNKRVGVIACAIAATIVSVGFIVASNMAHTANAHLSAAGDEGSLSGNTTINLPYDLGPDMADARDLMDDITFASVISVSRYLKATDMMQSYSATRGGGVPFPLTPGEGYMVRMATTTNYAVVGSHVPTLALTLQAAQSGVSLSGVNFVSLPFNIVARNAQELMDDIGFSNVISVSRYLKASNTWQAYTGRNAGEVNFPIRYDEAYLIKMGTTVNYVPSHY